MEQIKYIKSFIKKLSFWINPTLLKKTIVPCQKQNVMGLMGIVLVFNGDYNGVYRSVMDFIGGMLNSIGKMPKTQQKGIV